MDYRQRRTTGSDRRFEPLQQYSKVNERREKISLLNDVKKIIEKISNKIVEKTVENFIKNFRRILNKKMTEKTYEKSFTQRAIIN